MEKTKDKIEALVRNDIMTRLANVMKRRDSVSYVQTSLSIARKDHPIIELVVAILVMIRMIKRRSDNKKIDYQSAERIFAMLRSITYLSQMSFSDETENVDHGFLAKNLCDMIVEEGDLVRIRENREIESSKSL